MYQALKSKQKSIAVVGLGYVGLPLALEFARVFRVIGYDINAERVDLIRRHNDPSHQVGPEAFEGCDIRFTHNEKDLADAHFYIVSVPTAVDDHKVPDLRPLLGASQTIGKYLKKGDYVVFESTTYPGCTEEECVPLMEQASGLTFGVDFKVGYSPERINPGERNKSVADILKIIAGSDAAALETVSQVYGAIIRAGLYQAPSIRVAEAAKVVENIQRDLNISLMNELSILFDKLNLDTQEVLDAAGSKWNFMRLKPGLVGGHCIAVDPYYMLHKARQVGYEPQVMLSGRRVNDEMPEYIAKKMVQALIRHGKTPQNSKVLIMGLSFKENVADVRNSKVADLARELSEYRIQVDITDACATQEDVWNEHRLELCQQPANDYDAVIVAVAHDAYKNLDVQYFRKITTSAPILFDLKSLFSKSSFEPDFAYWRL